MRASTSLAVFALLALVAACSTRHRAADAAPPPTAAIELRAARGELLLALAPRDHGWELRLPGRGSQAIAVSAGGATLRGADGATIVELSLAGAAGAQLALADGRKLRVTFPRPHGAIDVIDAVGVAVLTVDSAGDAGGAVGRDGASQIVIRARPEADRIVLEGREGDRLGTVHQLPAGPDRDLAALLLGAAALDPGARAVLAAFVLSR